MLTTAAHATCDVSPTGRVFCGRDTVTNGSTNQNGAEAASSSRTQFFTNNRPIAADVAAGVNVSGAGLSLFEGRGRLQVPQAISLTNAGAITASGQTEGALKLRGNGGLVNYAGRGSVSSTDSVAILAVNSGDITILADGAVRAGTPSVKLVTPPALTAFVSGRGDIFVSGAGSVMAPAGRGIKVDQGPTGQGSLTVSGTGDVMTTGVVCPGLPNPDRVLQRSGKTGCSGIRATIANPANTRDVLVDRGGNVTGTSTAIDAATYGSGNVTVRTGANAAIVGVSEFGIEANGRGARSGGNILVATGAGGTLTSGGDGILASNLARRIDGDARSTIEIDAAGRITSGTFAPAAHNTKNPTGELAGISAGYVGGPVATPKAAVHGDVVINNAALITAVGGSGILGYHFGAGAIHIANRADVIAQAGNGIDTIAQRGSTAITITGGSTVTGAGFGRAGLNVVTRGGAIDVAVDAGATLRGANGAGGLVVTGATSLQKAAIRNAGTITGGDAPPSRPGDPPRFASGGVGIKGAALAIANRGSISGGVNADGTRAYAISFTGAANQVAGPGAIIGGINVTGTSSLMPALSGSVVGTPLAVGGPLRFATTATYCIRLTPNLSDSALVVGATTISGAKVQAVTGGVAPRNGTTYTILTASQGVVGRFSAVTSDLAFFRPTLGYGANTVTLIAHYDFRHPGATANQARVGAGLDTAAAARTDAARPISRALKQVPTAEGPAVLDTLSGEGLTAAQNIAHRSAELFTSSIFDQTVFYGSAANAIILTEPVRELADLPSRIAQPAAPVSPTRTWRAWATGFGGVEDIAGNAVVGSAAQQNTLYGGALGVDYQLTPNYLVGIALGGSGGAFQVPGRATSGTTSGGHIAIYDLATFGAFYNASSTSFSYYGNRSTRNVAGFGGLANEIERGSFASDEFRTRLEFGRHVAGLLGLGSGGLLTPFVALELAQLRTNGFREVTVSGPGNLGLAVAGQSTASVPAFVGLRLQRPTTLGGGLVLSPTLQVAYVHEFAPYRSQSVTIADLPGSTFLVNGAWPARDAAQIKAGAELSIGAHSVLFANLDGEFSGVSQLYAGKGGFAYFW